MYILQRAELDAILAASDSAELPNVARLAVASAMRLSEIVGLKLADVHLSPHTDIARHEERTAPCGAVIPCCP